MRRGASLARRAPLALLYFGIFCPVAWIARQVRDPLDRSWDGTRPSYFTRPR